MKAYPEYKVTELEWANQIPSHWKSAHLRWLSQIFAGGTPSKDKSEYWEDGTIPWIASGEVNQGYITSPTTYITEEAFQNSSAKWIPKDSLVMALAGQGKTKATVAQLGIDTTCNQSLAAIVPLSIKARYLFYWLQSNYQRIRGLVGDGLRDGLNLEILGSLPALLPTTDEQQAIADFLDRKTAQIDTLIAKKQQELELLREMRDVMTQDAMRSSKAKSLKLGDVADWIKRPMNRQDEEEYERIGLYNRGRGIFHKPITKGKDLGDSDFFEIKDGDFVISGQFAWEGAVALAQPEEDGCFASHRYYSLRGKPNKAETAYLFSFFTTQLGDNLLNHHSRGAAGRNRPLNINTLLREKIPVPPLSMQEPITALIKKEAVLKKHAQKLVEFLQEYRTALISEAVTGKVDVRTVHE